MNVHKNARLTARGRALMVKRICSEGWRVGAAAEASGVSERTAYRWLARYRVGGEPALNDRSSAPARCPHRVPADQVSKIEELRRRRLTGLQIACQLGLPRSTVGAILRRLGLGRLSALEPKAPVVRYQRDRPGELIHIDTKKLGRISGVGHRISGDRRAHRARGIGWEHLHVAIDDACRLAYTEILPTDRGADCAAFLLRAQAWFRSHGLVVEEVMTDNAWAYTHTRAFKHALQAMNARHLTTKPYCPRTNGKAERSSRPLCANGSTPDLIPHHSTGLMTCFLGYTGTITTAVMLASMPLRPSSA